MFGEQRKDGAPPPTTRYQLVAEWLSVSVISIQFSQSVPSALSLLAADNSCLRHLSPLISQLSTSKVETSSKKR